MTKNTLFCVIFFFGLNQLLSQSTEVVRSSPKIGLALSGGGAKGFAHIGLLKVLEEVGIRPDYITGTSAGSIVGGLYALGMNAIELEKLATNQNWDLILSNQIDLQHINIVEKENYNTHFLSLEYTDRKLVVPQGLIDGQELSLVLARLGCAGHFINDFDDFPIPFKCIAVNVINGEIVTLDSGYLARAQRASMAIPSIFTPVEYEGQLLVDGGVIRNFPVQEVIDMGAEFVIGSYTGGADAKIEELKTAFDILMQTSFLYSIADSKEQAKLCDFYIDLSEGYIASDFDKIQEIIDQGEKIARQHIEEIRAFAKKIGYVEKPALTALPYPDSLVIYQVNTESVNPALEQLVRKLLNIKEGKKYALTTIEDGIKYTYGTQFFQNVNYDLSSDSFGTTLHIDVKKAHPAVAKFGLHYSNADDAAIILKADLRNIFGKASSAYGGLRISKSPAFNLKCKQYIGFNRRFLYQIGTTYQKNDQYFSLQNGSLTRPYNRRKFDATAKLFWVPLNDFLLGLGYQWNSWEIEPNSYNLQDITEFNSTGNAAQFFIKYDMLDKVYFPKRGVQFQFTTSYNFGLTYNVDYTTQDANDFLAIRNPDSYFKANIFFSNYHPIKKSLIFFQHLGIGISTIPVLLDNFQLGGDFFNREQSIPFVGLQEYAAPFANVVNLQLGLRYYFSPKIMVSLRGNVAHGVDEFEHLFRDVNNQLLLGGGISLEYSSFMGPISFTIGNNNWNDKFQLSVNLGHRFSFF